MKRLLVGVLTSLTFGLSAQPSQSPEAFLGYSIGTTFSRHHQIEAYFQYIAQQHPETVKLQAYGKTPEGRNLFVAIVTSKENSAQLTTIQQHNVGLTSGETKDENQPTIVWLSYNVHGNEPASSEAAMLTLFELTNPANAKTSEWLKNTVVIIDPCLNPDGRDRYVNWFNNAVGSHYNPDPQAREHNEPWPSGRTNHYNFDLNRDWAWQTQAESQQRANLYHQWYPHVHVDFHEQGCDEPYYFAPAAEPIHQTVTPFQRDFQTKIGANHASYFDQNGWLYFTKERFDLLYPSYGDTYPMYNGAVGMTYEQGGIGGGLGITDEADDTLTLTERVQHHFTTSLSTIEVASINSGALVKAFKKYFDDSRTGTFSAYKTIVLTAKTWEELAGIKSILKKNRIEYGTISSSNFKAFDYQTGKDGTFKNEGAVLAVSMNQTHSVMANVLLEPKTVLADSNTYDITAWSLPYAYGIHAYASKAALNVDPEIPLQQEAIPASDFGYLIPYTSFTSSKVLGELLKNNIVVRYTEKPIQTNGATFERGTLLVLKTANDENWAKTTIDICLKFGIAPTPLSSGLMIGGPDAGSPDIRIIKKAPRVAFFTGDQVSALSAGELWNFFDHQLQYPATQLNIKGAAYYDYSQYDVLILPNGSYDVPLSESFKNFVQNGGTVIAFENAVKQLAATNNWGITLKEPAKNDSVILAAIPQYGNRERDELKNSIPGAIYKVYLDATHPLSFGLKGTYYDLKQSIDLYQLNKDIWNVGTIQKDSYISGFVGTKAKSNIQEGLVIGAKNMGAGSFIFMADDPIFRNFWESGNLLLSNAIFFHGL